MRHAALAMVCVLMIGCGAARKRGIEGPPAPTAGEAAYLIAGDFDAADRSFAASLDSVPSVTDAFLRGDLLDAIGRPEEALEMYFLALSTAHKEAREGDVDAAIAAAQAVTAIRDRVERFSDKLERFFKATLGDTSGGLPLEAWYQLLNLRFGLLRMRGEVNKDEFPEQLGCPAHWQSLGPFGPWMWAVFDEPAPPAADSEEDQDVSLGPGRGKASYREVTADTCFVAADNPSVPLGGTSWVRTVISRKHAGKVWVRLQTGMAAEVRIGGEEVLRRDPRNAFLSKVLWRTIELSAGEIEIEVKVAADGAAPAFSLVLLDVSGEPAFGASDPSLEPSTRFSAEGSGNLPRETLAEEKDDDAPVGIGRLYAKLKIALWQDDMERARSLYEKFPAEKQTSPILLQNYAELLGADPSLPMDLAYELGRPFLTRALDAEPRLWESRIGLADRALDEDRVLDSVAMLAEGRELCPEEVSILRRSAATYFSYGWSAEAEAAVAGIERLMPSSCATFDWRLAEARRRSRFGEAMEIAKQTARCDIFSESYLAELRRAHDFDGALAEARRLAALHPRSAAFAIEIAKSAVAAEHFDETLSAFEAARRLAPYNPAVTTALSDALRTAGKYDEAAAVIDQGLSHPFSAGATLEAARYALRGQPILSEYRVDGLKVIDAYKKELPEYDSAAVYVLDRAVYLVDEDGGIVMLVHAVTHLKTDEAVENHGELSVPAGARLLRARTIKADGRILEPQEISNKDTLSLPDLMPGDFVEYEYILSLYPNQLFPGGFDTERFYFQDFETGFHRTEMVLSVPSEVELELDPRGECPAPTEERVGNRRVITWRTRTPAPYPSEPLSPSAVAFLPSIRVASRTSWDALFRRINDQLADKRRIGHVVRAAVHEATAGIPANDAPARRRAIYRWVTRNIDPSRDMFEEASHIIARKAGNRARAFAAMLKASGDDARLVLVMPGGEDETPGALPSVKQFYLLLAAVPGDGLVDLSNEFVPYGFLSGRLRHRPFRYVDTGEIGRTTGGAVPRDVQEVSVSLTLSKEGDAAGRIRERLSGSLAGEWRAALEKAGESDYQRLFQSTYLAEAVPGARLTQLDIRGLKDSEAPLIFEYDVVVPGFAIPKGEDELMVKLPFATNFSKQSGGLPTRLTPLVLSLYVAKTVDTSIRMPSGMHAVWSGPPERTETTSWGSVRRTVLSAENTFYVKFDTSVDVFRVEPSDYTGFLAFSKDVDLLSETSFGVAR